jgi:hypothetical protein
MATNFNGADLSFGGTALNVIDVTYTEGEVPRVDATHAASGFKVYLAGIPEADSVSVTSYVRPGDPGDTGAFTGGNLTPDGTTYRLESVEESGSIDNAVTYTSTFVRTA